MDRKGVGLDCGVVAVLSSIRAAGAGAVVVAGAVVAGAVVAVVVVAGVGAVVVVDDVAAIDSEWSVVVCEGRGARHTAKSSASREIGLFCGREEGRFSAISSWVILSSSALIFAASLMSNCDVGIACNKRQK